MVLSLAIDPFTQQLVQYEQRLVFSESGETTLAYVRRYSKGNEFSMKIALDPCKVISASSPSRGCGVR